MLAQPAPATSPQTEAQLRRHEQYQLVEAYLRIVPLEDAAALGTTRPSLEPRGPRRTPWAAYEASVDRRLSCFPPALVRLAPTVFARLPWEEREVLRLTLSLDLTQAVCAALFHRSERWVRLRKSEGLRRMVAGIWPAPGPARRWAVGPAAAEGAPAAPR